MWYVYKVMEHMLTRAITTFNCYKSKFNDMNFVKVTVCVTYVLHYVSGAVRWLDMFVVRYVYKVIDLSWNICSPEQLQQSFTTLASSCNSSAIFMVMTQISFLFYSVSPALASDVPGPGELVRSDGVWLLQQQSAAWVWNSTGHRSPPQKLNDFDWYWQPTPTEMVF